MITEERKRELQRLSSSDVPWLRECNLVMPEKTKSKIHKMSRAEAEERGLFKEATFITDKVIEL